MYPCKYCKKHFSSETKYKRHEKYHEKKNYRCDLCASQFKIKKVLKLHKQEVHGEEKPNKEFKCLSCDKVFKEETWYKKHINMHNPQHESKFICPLCNQVLTCESFLKMHLKKRHNGGTDSETRYPCYFKKVVCERCGKELLKRNLRIHMMSHYNEKPHKCEYCGKNFITRKCLAVHLRIHTKEKPYRCTFCPKSFTQKYSVTIHTRYHTGEKPHCCNICPKRLEVDGDTILELEDDLDVSGHSIDQYQCGICSDLFPTKSGFMNHHLKHFSGNKFICCKCKEIYKDANSLYQHHERHRVEEEANVDEEAVQEVLFNLGDPNELIEVHPGEDIDDFLYILDDNNSGSRDISEVIVQDDENVQRSTASLDPVTLLNMEHGYMLPSSLHENRSLIKKSILKTNALAAAKKNITLPTKTVSFPSSTKDLFKSSVTLSVPAKDFLLLPKARLTPPKKRHEVPDFTAANYEFVKANEEIDVAHFKCTRCEQLFINKFSFFRHIEKGKCYINNCDMCNATFTKNKDFLLHYTSIHIDRAICNFCFRTFMYEKNVKEHMLRHLDQFRHKCEECNKGFYTVREYRNHYKNRHMGIRHKCDACGRSFADEYYFKKHIATHAKAANLTVLHLAEENI